MRPESCRRTSLVSGWKTLCAFRLSAYDSAKYGTVDGRVIRISPDAVVDERNQGASHYLVDVAIEGELVLEETGEASHLYSWHDSDGGCPVGQTDRSGVHLAAHGEGARTCTPGLRRRL